MRCAVISDLHADFYDQPGELLREVADRCAQAGAEVLIFAGDLGNGEKNELALLAQLHAHLSTKKIDLLHIPGNHSIWVEPGAPQGESLRAYHRLTNLPESLCGKPRIYDSAAIVGGMGWYDYSGADPYWSEAEFDQMRNYNDGKFCKLGMSNIAFARVELQSLEQQLSSLPETVRTRILVTHIVPYKQALDPRWRGSYGNAFFACTGIGDLARKFKVDLCIFGHTHHASDGRIYGGAQILCAPLGYPGEHPLDQALRFITVDGNGVSILPLAED